jgi:hypothetical protein
MIRSTDHGPVPTIGPPLELDPAERTAFAARHEKFLRNMTWFEQNLADIRTRYGGRFVCVAGGQVFVADSAREAVALAHTAHPDERGAGYFTYVTPVRGAESHAIRG